MAFFDNPAGTLNGDVRLGRVDNGLLGRVEVSEYARDDVALDDIIGCAYHARPFLQSVGFSVVGKGVDQILLLEPRYSGLEIVLPVQRLAVAVSIMEDEQRQQTAQVGLFVVGSVTGGI